MNKTDYKLNVNDIKNGLRIIEKAKIETKEKEKTSFKKAYKYECIKCKYMGIISQSNLIYNKRGCPVCSNQKIIKGVNDIATTHPYLVKYFANIEDAYKYSPNSTKKLKFVCQDCGREKLMEVRTLKNYGIGCKCGDGISYPEKVVFNLLRELKSSFETEKIFDWNKDKRYDFYIPLFSCIIETHGGQHYEDVKGFFAKTKEDEQENDEFKRKIALKNGIKYYIEIDCRKSEFDWIKNNILQSEVSKLFDLRNVDWNGIQSFSEKNIVKEVCLEWEKIKDTKELSKMFCLHRSTIIGYLKRGAKIGWCLYDPKKEAKKTAHKNGKSLGKAVVANEKTYLSISDFCKENGFDRTTVTKWLDGKKIKKKSLIDKFTMIDLKYKQKV